MSVYCDIKSKNSLFNFDQFRIVDTICVFIESLKEQNRREYAFQICKIKEEGKKKLCVRCQLFARYAKGLETSKAVVQKEAAAGDNSRQRRTGAFLHLADPLIRHHNFGIVCIT